MGGTQDDRTFAAGGNGDARVIRRFAKLYVLAAFHDA
jgi:hypothetical protein